jgi:hypothetical protein
MIKDKIIHISGFNQTPYLKDLIDKHNKVVIINKTGSCGPSFGIDIQKEIFFSDQLGIPFYSVEEITRKIKKEFLPDYVKQSLKRCRL